MNYEVACGSMRLIADLGRKGFLDGIGCTQADFNKLVSDNPWLATDRNRMTTTLHCLINASVDSMGLPRFNLPAEYIAAGIAMFVAGVNVHAACIFAPPARTAEDVGRGEAVGCDPVSSEKLFGLVCQLYKSDVRTSARALFEKNTGLAFDKAVSISSSEKTK